MRTCCFKIQAYEMNIRICFLKPWTCYIKNVVIKCKLKNTSMLHKNAYMLHKYRNLLYKHTNMWHRNTSMLYNNTNILNKSTNMLLKGIVNLFSCGSLKIHHTSCLNIYENIGFYLFKFITTLYQYKNFSHSLFLLHLVFYKYFLNKIYYAELFNAVFLRLEKLSFVYRMLRLINNSYFSKLVLGNGRNRSSLLGLQYEP